MERTCLGAGNATNQLNQVFLGGITGCVRFQGEGQSGVFSVYCTSQSSLLTGHPCRVTDAMATRSEEHVRRDKRDPLRVGGLLCSAWGGGSISPLL